MKIYPVGKELSQINWNDADQFLVLPKCVSIKHSDENKITLHIKRNALVAQGKFAVHIRVRTDSLFHYVVNTKSVKSLLRKINQH